MTDPLAGPPQYLPRELVDLLTEDVLVGLSDRARRRRIRRWGELCFAAGYAHGYDDLTAADEDRPGAAVLADITTTAAPPSTALDMPAVTAPADDTTPLYDQLTTGAPAGATRRELPS